MEDKYPNWFKITAQENFERFLIPLAGQDNLTFLQLGAYTGDASVWMVENVLTGENSTLIDVDTWQGSDEEVHHTMDFDDVFTTYRNKIEQYRPKILYKQITTTDYLLKYNYIKDYDFVYVDADHTAASALIDGELAWHYLKPNGILAFDDYTWGPDLPPHLSPKLGVNLFIHRYQGQFENLVVNGQVWLRKL